MSDGDWKVEKIDGETVLLERFASGKFQRVAKITSNDWIKFNRGALVSTDQMKEMLRQHDREKDNQAGGSGA